jgi:hypothetical protein
MTSGTSATPSTSASTPDGAQHSAGQAVEPAPYTPPDPRARARQLLEESQRTLEEALRRVRSGDPAASAELVGRASTGIGNALYYLRSATRR